MSQNPAVEPSEAQIPTISYQIDTDPTHTPEIDPINGRPGGIISICFYEDSMTDNPGANSVILDETLASRHLQIDSSLVYDDRFFALEEDTSWMSPAVRDAIASGAEEAKKELTAVLERRQLAIVAHERVLASL